MPYKCGADIPCIVGLPTKSLSPIDDIIDNNVGVCVVINNEAAFCRQMSEGITSVLSALGFLNPGLHLMQTLFINLSRAHNY
jgi:hypothetical protein